jgi:hypothetical protein
MLGIEDPWILAAYLLCLISAALCVVYGLLRWNSGEEPVDQQDVRWAEEEKKVEEEL